MCCFSVAFGLTVLPLISLGPSPAGVPQALDAIRLPVTIVKSNPVTTITVAGQTIQAIVDIGGDVDGALTLSKEVIDGASAAYLDTVVTNDGAGREFKRPRFRVPVAGIGGQTFDNMVVVQAPDLTAGEGPAVPNAIGREFLSRYLVVLDYASASITLWPPDTVTPPGIDCGRIHVPMKQTEEDRLVVSDFETQSGRVRLLWDTGATYSVLSEAIAGKLELPTTVRGPDSPKFYQSRMLSAAGQDVGPLEFVVLPLEVSKDFDGMLGRNFFEHHVVCLDYRREEIRVR